MLQRRIAALGLLACRSKQVLNNSEQHAGAGMGLEHRCIGWWTEQIWSAEVD